MTSTTDQQTNSGSPVQNDALEALAVMTGYQSETRKTLLKESESESESEHESELLDEEDLDAAEFTKTPIWSNPIAKMFFVAAAAGMFFGTVGFVLFKMNHRETPVASAEQTVDNSDPIGSAEETQQAEIGRLKTTAALGSQMETLNQNSKNSGATIRPQVPNQVNPSPVPRSAAATAPQPQPIALPRSTYSSPRVSPSYSAPSSRVSSGSSVRSAPAPTPQVDPQQAWLSAQALGSYGQTSSTNTVAFNASTPTQAAAVPAPSQASELASSPTSEQSQYEADSSALITGIRRTVVLIPPGETATAKLTTPVIWAQDMAASDQPQRFNIELSAPIYDQNGDVAFPEGTNLVASVNSVSDSGLLVLSVNNAIVPGNNGEQVMEVPEGAIQISSDGGRPLVAKDYRSGNSQMLSHDIETTLLGALSNVGSLLNRPTSQTTTTSPYLSSSSTTNGNTNIFGGVLEGGFGALQNSLSQRQQTQIQAILSRPHIWYVPQGTKVQVFVNRQIQSQF